MAGRCFRVLHKYSADKRTPYSLIIENTRNVDDFLLFESNVIASLNSESCEQFKRVYTKLTDAYGIMGILQLNNHRDSHIDSYLVIVTGVLSVGKIRDADIYRVTGVQFLSMSRPLPTNIVEPIDERVAEVQKLVSNGMFYFGVSLSNDSTEQIDLSLCSQKYHDGLMSDDRFFWNRSLHLPFQRYGIETNKWLLRCMCGSVIIRTVYVGHRTAKACVISRLSCERMGTRFNVRGVNDDGNVANFVETEQVIFYEQQVVSFVQTRGSVPLFWEQPGIQVGSHKVKFSRGIEASAPAYDRHFKSLKKYYGNQVIINLLGSKEGEKMLSAAFKMHHDNSPHCSDIPYIAFDYHALVRGANNKQHNLNFLWQKMADFIQRSGFFHSCDDRVLSNQTGMIRTNCLDCLDRTNSVQSYFGMQILSRLLIALQLDSNKTNIESRFEEVFRDLWQKNGDQCSVIYSGTGALEGKSMLRDASRSVARTIQNNLLDSSKQEAMDLLLLGSAISSELYDRAANFLPINIMQGQSLITECPNALTSLIERIDEFTVSEPLRIFVGTWNVNGGKNMHNVAFRNQAHLTDWLFDMMPTTLVESTSDLTKCPDIVAIGLEEIVDLNASNIMKTSTTNQRLWSEGLRKALCGRGCKYILINCQQLVGVCLFIFIRPKLAPYMRDLGTEVVKTGLGGATGNKGSVAFRMLIHSTSICFVCSHFAAGQKEILERNADYNETVKRIRFPMGRTIYSHDVVFWFGDFNYRIDRSGDDVKNAVRANDYTHLIESDQLTVQRQIGTTFVNFKEGDINFAPTYKYDTFSDDYDTSEKCRSPAWTDRVLWYERASIGNSSSSMVTQLLYNRAELKTSDHRPVGALFDVNTRRVDRIRRDCVYKEIISGMGPPDSTVLVSVGDANPFPSDAVDFVIEKVQQLHIPILLVKFVGADMWLIFEDGTLALAALSMDGVILPSTGRRIDVRLRSPDWDTDSRLLLNSSPSADLIANYSLLGDDSETDAAQFLSDDDDEEVAVAVQLLQSQQLIPTKPPPSRPPPPRNAASANTLVQTRHSPTPTDPYLLNELTSIQQPPIPMRPNSMLLLSAAPPNEAPPWDSNQMASPASCYFETDFIPTVPPRPNQYRP